MKAKVGTWAEARMGVGTVAVVTVAEKVAAARGLVKKVAEAKARALMVETRVVVVGMEVSMAVAARAAEVRAGVMVMGTHRSPPSTSLGYQSCWRADLYSQP